MKSKTYDEFVEKFKPKLTTDDCYTPEPIYEAIRDWACQEYSIDPETIVRPFWPGADYQAVDYPAGCVVLDNPPFSILSKICEWYLDHGIKFFLFAPTLTALGGKNICMRMNHIICSVDIVYANGAKVKTSFVTNLGDGETICQTEPKLDAAIREAIEAMEKGQAAPLPAYDYPSNILTAAMLQRYSLRGVKIEISRNECVRVTALDSQRENKKAIFGGGLLLSNRAAERNKDAKKAAKAALQKAATEREERGKESIIVWPLSYREKAIIADLDSRSAEDNEEANRADN